MMPGFSALICAGLFLAVAGDACPSPEAPDYRPYIGLWVTETGEARHLVREVETSSEQVFEMELFSSNADGWTLYAEGRLERRSRNGGDGARSLLTGELHARAGMEIGFDVIEMEAYRADSIAIEGAPAFEGGQVFFSIVRKDDDIVQRGLAHMSAVSGDRYRSDFYEQAADGAWSLSTSSNWIRVEEAPE